eukprot:CAMPEP_0197930174 /NCGR_PEP_ID=MMETSP1439-20131203/105023_1 /TAXON_ID=66791 /ORGANISM="Gonyaulax spinifera, Strain CCMP409" /LENGTH=353 /DNA_ID=CAMNT_0043552853 /DNA_START=38 /DNA_END=1099 /DNA_ORIENTATION=-
MALAVQELVAEAGSKLDSGIVEERCEALQAIASSGESGKVYFDKILKIASESSIFAEQRGALDALASTSAGKETQAISVLSQNLSSTHPAVRSAAARGLGVLKADTCVAKLGALLTDQQMLVRSAALEALAAVGPKATSEVQAVAANLKAPLLRGEALKALGSMGKDGAAHADEIAAFLEDSDSNVRLAVAQAFGELRDFLPDHIVDQVGTLLGHQSDRFRATAALTIGQLGMAKAGKYVDKLVRMLRENMANQNRALLAPNCAAAIALGDLGVKGEQVAAYLNSKNPDMRAAACQGLAKMGKAGIEHASAISLLLEDEVVWPAALSALENLQGAGSLDSSVVKMITDAKAKS